MLEYIKITKDDVRYPDKLKQIKNPPNQIYAIRKYKIIR